MSPCYFGSKCGLFSEQEVKPQTGGQTQSRKSTPRLAEDPHTQLPPKLVSVMEPLLHQPASRWCWLVETSMKGLPHSAIVTPQYQVQSRCAIYLPASVPAAPPLLAPSACGCNWCTPSLGTATPPCPDHAGSAPNTLTGAEVVLLCRMFLRGRIGRIELTIHASGGRHRGSHRAAVVAYVPLIFGSSNTPVGRTSPYVPRASACSRTYRLQFVSL